MPSGTVESNVQVMLLAAGRGSRLGALGAALPKPLVPICGYPPIAYGLSLCRDAGLIHVVVNVHHLGDMIEDAVGDGGAFGLHVRFSIERDLLGTGGGLAFARRLFRSEPVLVMNAKVVADVDLKAFIAAHVAAGPDVVATMALRPAPVGGAFAPVQVDEAGRVVSIRGVRGPYEAVGAIRSMMFTGIHVVTGRLLDRLPREGESDVIAEAYLPALQAGEVVRFVEVPGYFEEHSTPERYWEGNMALLRKPSLICSAPGPLIGADPSCIIHATADLQPPYRIGEGALIEAGAVVGPNVVVGAGATIARNARVSHTVVWQGSVVEGQVTIAVVTKDEIVSIQPPGSVMEP